MNRHQPMFAVAAAFASASLSSAMMIFNELASGDLSNNAALPTFLPVDLGSNFLFGTVSSQDRDYFTLRLPPGTALASILLRQSDGVQDTFLGLQAGSSFTEPPQAANLTRTLGYTTFFPSDVNTDLLPRLADAPEAIGFSGPLAGIDFTFWVEQKHTSPAAYDFEFIIVGIPSPGAWVLGLAGLGMSLWSTRRSRSIATMPNQPRD